jgi:threonine dehydrogenase-like Zn-dependent dehydrogenase
VSGKEGGIGPMVMKKPNILGHESAGVIIAAGSGVKNVKVGDRVAIELGFSYNSYLHGFLIFTAWHSLS